MRERGKDPGVKTLVMIEDDAIYRRTLERASRWRRPSYRWEMCGTCAQAMAFLDSAAQRAVPLAGLLVDVRLPDGSGLDVLARARELFPSTSAVVMTADASTREAAEALSAGWVFKDELDIAWVIDELEY